MKTSTAVGITLAAVVLAAGSLLIEAWLLGIILSWFSVSLTFWQNFAIIILANMIFNNFGVSSK